MHVIESSTKKNHIKVFGKKCEELLNSTPIEIELEHLKMCENRANMELTNNAMTFIMQKAKIKAEGERKGKIG